jgi:uncharacterized repeat protein (TIGR03987 family)
MPPLIRAAVFFMVAALGLYSVGVWSAFLSRHLRPWHASLFWLGFLSDTAGTELMRQYAGGFHWGIHAVLGATALLLMLGHALWATFVLTKGAERQLRMFHWVSILVWAIWLIPFVTGLILGRRRSL